MIDTKSTVNFSNDAEFDFLEEQVKSAQEKYFSALSVRKANAIEEILYVIKRFGISAEDIGMADISKVQILSRKQARMKYWNPKDTSQCWTGKGRMPKLLRALLDEGTFSLSEMLVPKGVNIYRNM